MNNHAIAGLIFFWMLLIIIVLVILIPLNNNYLFVATNTVDQTILYSKEFNNRQKCTTVMVTAIDIAGEVKAPLFFECIEL